jgi:hypothetical protein
VGRKIGFEMGISKLLIVLIQSQLKVLQRYNLMTKDSPKEGNLKAKERIEIAQGILNILRDFSIFLIFSVLIVVPEFMNRQLIKAGIVKVQLPGITWEKQLKKTDAELVEAGNQINSLKKNLEKSSITISKLKEKGNINDPKAEEQLNKNREAIQKINSTNIAIQSTIRDNTPLLSPSVNTSLMSLVDIANEYKIQIFYNQDKLEQKNVALEIKSALERTGVKSNIQVLPHPSQIDKATDDQIRYFAENEREVAYALQNILNETYSKRKFKLQTVYTPSPGSVSIFLKS